MRHLGIPSLFVLSFACMGGSGRAGQADVDYFLRDYPAAAEKLRAKYQQIKGECRLTVVDVQKTSVVDDLTFAADHGLQKVSILQGPRKGQGLDRRQNLYCVGPNWSFSLIRSSEKDPYSVNGIGSDDRDRTMYFSRFGRFLSLPYAILGTPLTEIMKHPYFRLTSVERITENDKEFVKISYDNGKSPQSSNTWLKIDPSLGWVIRSGEIQPEVTKGQASIYFEVEYGSGQEIPPLPRIAKYVDVNRQTLTCEFTKVSRDPTPESEFSMPFYGLADLIAPAPSASRFHLLYWAMGSAIVALVVAVLMRRFLGEHRKLTA